MRIDPIDKKSQPIIAIYVKHQLHNTYNKTLIHLTHSHSSF